MKFSVEWEQGAHASSDIDLCARGGLSILVDGKNACAFRAAGEYNPAGPDCLFVSAYPLAEGIAMDWWRLFGGRDVRHRLIGYRGGYAVPDIHVRFDGAGFDVECVPYAYDNPPLRFPVRARERLDRAAVETGLGSFLIKVLDRLESQGVRDSALRIQWDCIQASRKNADEAAFCEAAGALGLDPYDMSDVGAEFLMQCGAEFEGDALSEFLAGIRRCLEPGKTPNRGPRAENGAARPSHDTVMKAVQEVLDWISAVERRPRRQSRIPALEDCRKTVSNALRACADKSWARGYRCARAIRRRLSAPQAERFRSVSVLARRLGAPSFRVAPPVPGVSALVQSGEDTRIHLGEIGNPAGRLFAFARAIGDATANPPAARSVVNDLRDASRQACGRAFAAEFLAPVEEIASMRADGRDTDAIADEFGVSSWLVDRQEENADRIRQACA